MLSTGFEPVVPASERPQTHALDRAATGIGYYDCQRNKIRVWSIGGMILTEGTKVLGETPTPVLHCQIQPTMWGGMESNPGIQDHRAVTNSLGIGTAR